MRRRGTAPGWLAVMVHNRRMQWFRPELADLPSYVAGKRPRNADSVKLSSNEVPFPPTPAVAAALAAAVAQGGELNRYPDMSCAQLTAALAAYENWDPAGIVVGNGSTALIEKFLQAVVTPGGDVVSPWRSFEAYPIATIAAGGRFVGVPLRADGTHDLEAMAAAITENTRAILLCSPNNPTGTTIPHAELASFLAKVPARIPVLLDEAYIHFAPAVGESQASRAVVQNGKELARQYPNVAVARTFSKAFALAGLRLGYLLTSPALAEPLRRIATPFGINRLAQVAGQAALTEADTVLERAAQLAGARDELATQLAAAGWHTPTSHANFLWVSAAELDRHGVSAARFEDACMDAGVLVRVLGEGVRISVAEPEGSTRVLAAVRALGERSS